MDEQKEVIVEERKKRGALAEDHRKKISDALKGNKNRIGGNKNLQK